jgi:aminoglycoside phosphotransferase (APT) family kinase protein
MRSNGHPDDRQLLGALRDVLRRRGLEPPVSLRRRPSEYRSSFPLEELEVRLERGGELRLAFKRLEWEGMSAAARLAKPRFLHDPRREPAVYSSVLPAGPAGPPRYFGSVAREDGAHWLFIEWVEGRELYQVGDRAIWARVAAWLAEAHASLSPELELHVAAGHLRQSNAPALRRWIGRAREFAAAEGRSEPGARFLAWLEGRYDPVVEALLEMPKTVIHGDFCAANVLVAGDGDALRVAPVDWESAAAGPALIDLAALISGEWTGADRERLVAAYATVPGALPFSSKQLDAARLHLAVQWLGWAPPAWAPPREQRHDWLADAVGLAEGLDL